MQSKPLTEEQKESIDRALSQISHRITLERLTDKVQGIAELRTQNRQLLQLLQMVYVVFIVRNDMQLLIDAETKTNKAGQPQSEAETEVNNVIDEIIRVVAMYL